MKIWNSRKLHSRKSFEAYGDGISENPSSVHPKKTPRLSTKGFQYRRVNTEPENSDEYRRPITIKLKNTILKGKQNPYPLLCQNASKNREYLSKPAIDFWSRVSYNEFEWSGLGKSPGNMKNSKLKRGNYYLNKEKNSRKNRELQQFIKQKYNVKNKTNLLKEDSSNSNPKWKQDRNLNTEMLLSMDIRLKEKNQQKQHADIPYEHPYEHEDTEYSPEEKYVLGRILGAGTFGEVFEATNLKTKQKVAIKKVYHDRAYKNRELQIMGQIDSPFVINVLQQYVTYEGGQSESKKEYINIVIPKYNSNFYEYLKSCNSNLSNKMLKAYLYQMFRGIMHLHSRGICHRDLKPQNMLLKNNRLVICDLGSAKFLSKDENNISYICSRCYRAPELIFGSTNYSFSIDIWSAGCIILQILNKSPLFVGKDSLHHLVEIIKIMGSPTKNEVLRMNEFYDVSKFSIHAVRSRKWSQIFLEIDLQLQDLLNKIMIYSPDRRLSAGEVLCHSYFAEVREKQYVEEMKQIMDVTDFFTFDEHEIRSIPHPHRLIPLWYIA